VGGYPIPRLLEGPRQSGLGDRGGRGGNCFDVFHSGEHIKRLIVLYSIRESLFVVVPVVATESACISSTAKREQTLRREGTSNRKTIKGKGTQGIRTFKSAL
jgi:hypothetical protein